MWHNKASNTQRTLCNDCCRPKCTASTCNTCKVCRQPHHKRKNCEDDIVALEKSSWPTHVDQLKTWLCSVCKANICSNWPHCQKQRKAKKSQSEAQYTCGECQTLAFTQEEHRKHVPRRSEQHGARDHVVRAIFVICCDSRSVQTRQNAFL